MKKKSRIVTHFYEGPNLVGYHIIENDPFEDSTLPAGFTANVSEVMVMEAFQGQGRGKKIFDDAFAMCKQLGIKEPTAICEESNGRANAILHGICGKPVATASKHVGKIFNKYVLR